MSVKNKILLFVGLVTLTTVQVVYSQQDLNGRTRISSSGFSDALIINECITGSASGQPGAILFQRTGSSNLLWIGGPSFDGNFWISAQQGFGANVAVNYLMSFDGSGSAVNVYKDLLINSGSNPNVGIGTSSPSARLHTVGNIRFESLPSNNVTSLVGVDANGNVNQTSLINLNSSVDDYATYARTSTSTTPSGTKTVAIQANGRIAATEFLATSDLRYKKDVSPIENPMKKILGLKGVTYNWRSDELKTKGFDSASQIGFIAQDVAKVLPEAVMVDKDGFFSIKYNSIIPVVIEAIKQQQIDINRQNNEISELKKEISILKNLINKNEQNDGKLMQNTPNPFNEQTEINYIIYNDFKNAAINIYDLQGKQIQHFELKGKGLGKVTVKNNIMAAGMYFYSLIVDGKEIDTKKMIIGND